MSSFYEASCNLSLCLPLFLSHSLEGFLVKDRWGNHVYSEPEILASLLSWNTSQTGYLSKFWCCGGHCDLFPSKPVGQVGFVRLGADWMGVEKNAGMSGEC